MKSYPLKFSDIFKEKIWGGRQLASVLGKRLPPERPIGESWEIADHGEDTSIIKNGTYAGVPLHEHVLALGTDLMGTQDSPSPKGTFPLLIKFLDAQDWLSVQVHPHDEYAQVHENGEQGKTEAWYVVSANPGAKLICGFSEQTTAEALRLAIQSERLGELLREVAVQAGDVVFVPAGRVHTLGPGTVVCEVQQNSDVTYRLFDWGRVGANGRPRDLHIDDALKVIDCAPTAQAKIPPVVLDSPGCRRTYLVACRYFAAELLEVQDSWAGCCDGRTFQALCVLEGAGTMQSEGIETGLRQGESILLPASLGPYQITPRDSVKLMKSYVPDLRKDIVDPLREQGRTDSEIAALGGEGTGNDLAPLLSH